MDAPREMYERAYGCRFVPGEYLGAAEIAKRVRGDLKNAVKLGLLPDVKMWVRSDSFSGGQSVDVWIDYRGPVSCPECQGRRSSATYAGQHGDLCQTCAAWECGNPGWMHPDARPVYAFASWLLNAYNYDGSEIQVDYFDVNYYGNVHLEPPYDVIVKRRG
jgi:hypothetical protein